MSFGINTEGLRTIENYNAAVKRFEETKPWRGYSEHDGRAIGMRTKKHMNIRMNFDGSVACRLYHTDVVVFNKDDSLTLNPYSSNSTNRFASAIMPYGISLHNHIVWVGTHWDAKRGYKIGRQATFRRSENGWTPEEGETKPFKKYVVNRERAKVALKEHNYTEFSVWLNMAQYMIKKSGDARYYGRSFGHRNHPYVNVREVIEMMGERSNWKDIAEEYLHGTASHLLSMIREEIYKQHGCYDMIELPYVDGWKHLANVENSQR